MVIFHGYVSHDQMVTKTTQGYTEDLRKTLAPWAAQVLLRPEVMFQSEKHIAVGFKIPVIQDGAP